MGGHAMDNQEANNAQNYNTLQHCIDSWVKLQQLFHPVLAIEHTREAQDAAESLNSPEMYPLMLPSQLSPLVPCHEKLKQIEWRLRIAQAHDALHSLWANLHTWSCILKYKDWNLCGQGANTRAYNILKVIKLQIDAGVNQYDNIHNVLVRLMLFLKETG